jgi:predicted ArsR family transcriptional regulator
VANVDEQRDQELLIQSRALGDPTRHAIFVQVRDADEPVSVAELTAAFGLNHNAIRQHLAKLRQAGLVAEQRDRPAGPGRPPVRYRVVPGVAERWGSPVAYEVLTLLLLEMVRTGASPVEAGRSAGRHLAEEHGTDADAVEILDAVARKLGFDPQVQERRNGVDVVLARCPFVRPAAEAPEVVCMIHRGIAEGIAESSADHARVVDLVVRPPQRANCRIKVVRPGERR